MTSRASPTSKDVIARHSWPNVARTEARLGPFLPCCVANGWRRAWGDASAIPAAPAYVATTFAIERGRMGSPNALRKSASSSSLGRSALSILAFQYARLLLHPYLIGALHGRTRL
jgi:hypothetical protein